MAARHQRPGRLRYLRSLRAHGGYEPSEAELREQERELDRQLKAERQRQLQGGSFAPPTFAALANKENQQRGGRAAIELNGEPESTTNS